MKKESKIGRRMGVAALAMCLIMLFSACAAVPAEQPQQESEPSQEVTATQPAESAVESEDVEAEPTDAQPVDKDIQDMHAVLDSVIGAMQQSGSAYAPKDESFFWTTLYLMGVHLVDESDCVEMTDDGSLKVIRQTMQEFAAASFEEYDDLLEVPDDLAASLTYDEGWDAYMLVPSDIGDSHSQVVDVTTQDDTILVTVEKVSGEDKETYVFTLIENPYLDAIANPLFAYTVRGAEKID